MHHLIKQLSLAQKYYHFETMINTLKNQKRDERFVKILTQIDEMVVQRNPTFGSGLIIHK